MGDGSPKVFLYSFFLCLAERAVKHCRSSRTREKKTTGNPLHLQNQGNKNNQKDPKQTNTTNRKRPPASAREGGETGETVRHPKRPHMLNSRIRMKPHSSSCPRSSACPVVVRSSLGYPRRYQIPFQPS